MLGSLLVVHFSIRALLVELEVCAWGLLAQRRRERLPSSSAPWIRIAIAFELENFLNHYDEVL